MNTNKLLRSARPARARGLSLLLFLGVVVSCVMPTQRAEASSTRCTANIYSYGGYSTCVGYIQILANHKLPFITGHSIATDNSFGPQTRSAILAIQTRWRLAADGVVGRNTWAALCSDGTTSRLAGGPFNAAEAAAARNAGC